MAAASASKSVAGKPGAARKVGRPAGQTARRDDRREELLHVAAAVFAERGYHRASMREIGERWNVRQAAIYYYFPSKAKILQAICEYAISQFLDRLAVIEASDLPAAQKVRLGVRAHIEPLIEQRFYVHAFLFQRRELPDEARLPLDAKARAYEALWDAILTEGQKEGTISSALDRRLAVLAILGMCNTVARWSRTAAEFGLDQVAESFTQLLSTGLFGAGVANAKHAKPAPVRSARSRKPAKAAR